MKKIWIDLDNSPHVPFFLPIIEELEKRNYKLLLTARDSYQVCELLHFYRLSCRVIGKHYGRKKILKLLGTALRAVQLMPMIVREKPDLVVSHGSRAQLLAAWLLRIPSVLMFDYEFSAMAFLQPDWVFVPDLIPVERIRLKPSHVLRYHGLKEDAYVPRFKPDGNIRELLGIQQDEILVALRPPATEAHYHNPEGEEFLSETIRFLLDQPKTRVVMLPRNENQSKELRSCWIEPIRKGKIIVPQHAVNGLDLIWSSDLVISGGGTMNREAAAMGAPVFSIFRGHIGAVDRYLASSGRLTLIEKLEDIRKKIILKRCSGRAALGRQTGVLECIVNGITLIAEQQSLQPHARD